MPRPIILITLITVRAGDKKKTHTGRIPMRKLKNKIRHLRKQVLNIPSGHVTWGPVTTARRALGLRRRSPDMETVAEIVLNKQ